MKRFACKRQNHNLHSMWWNFRAQRPCPETSESRLNSRGLESMLVACKIRDAVAAFVRCCLSSVVQPMAHQSPSHVLAVIMATQGLGERRLPTTGCFSFALSVSLQQSLQRFLLVILERPQTSFGVLCHNERSSSVALLQPPHPAEEGGALTGFSLAP